MQKKFKLGPLQRKWIRALKSGKFKKGTLCLHCEEDNSYCCLGVANECLNLKETSSGFLSNTYKRIGLFNSSGVISNNYKFPRGTKLYGSLVEMNDKNISHKKIAEFLENNPELVFTKSV
jgi:hypothetical protein